MTRILVAGHSLVNALNRRRLDALAREPGLHLTALVPDRWTGSHGEEYTVRAADAGAYALIPHRVFLRGRNRHQLYVYGPGIDARFAAAAPELVHIDEEPYSAAAFQLARLAARHRVPFVISSSQNIAKRFPPPFAWMERWVLARARAAFAMPGVGEVLRAKGFTGPIEPAAHGLDLDDYRPGRDEALRRQLGLAGPVLGYIGRLEPVKGVHVLLEAAARLPDLTVLIVGSGGERAALDALARARGLDGRVRWVPAVAHADVPRYIGLMDVLVVPSVSTPTIREQFGRVAIEGMACGVPVVGSSSGSLPDVIGDGGLVFPEGDAARLAACVSEALAPPVRARLVEAGHARVRARVTWTAVARDFARAYREALAR